MKEVYTIKIIYLNKRKFSHNKKVQLAQDRLETPTWLLSHCVFFVVKTTVGWHWCCGLGIFSVSFQSLVLQSNHY